MASGESGSTSQEEGRGEKTQVTIKGVDKELYERAVQTARELGMTIGELVNRSLKAFLTLTDTAGKAVTSLTQTVTESGRALVEGVRQGAQGVKTISNIDELTISKSDLESLDTPVSFRGIKRLVFTDDVTWDLFNSKVASIILCDEVVLPKSVPKLRALEKMRFVKRVTQA